jgi:hypothetical protein
MTPDSWVTAAEVPERGPHHRHAPGHRGRLDESARRLSHEELAVARLLVREGHDVRSVATGLEKSADLTVCLRETEIKTPQLGATRATVNNELRRARNQGTDVIIDARHSGLQRLPAQQGVADFAGRFDRGRVESVRVLGAGFDLSYRAPDLDRLRRGREGHTFGAELA